MRNEPTTNPSTAAEATTTGSTVSSGRLPQASAYGWSGADALHSPIGARHAERQQAAVLCLVVGAPLAYGPIFQPPYPEPKLLVGWIGMLFAAAAGLRAPRAAMMSGAAVVVSGAVSTALSPDPYTSLFGLSHSSTGLLLLGLAGGAFVLGSTLAVDLLPRIPKWTADTATLVAAVHLLGQVPTFTPDFERYGLTFGSTLGQSVHMAAFMALGLLGTTAVTTRPAALLGLQVVAMASALSLAANRSGVVALAVGLAVLGAKRAVPIRRAAGMALLTALVIGAWTGVDLLRGDPVPTVSPVRRVADVGEYTSVSERRIHAADAVLAWSERPLVGWGPANSWGPVLAQSAAVGQQSRFYQDPHNIIVGALVTTGALGLASLAALAGVAGLGAMRGPRPIAWSAGGTAILAVHHLLQPLNAALTPLLFLLAGACASAFLGSRLAVPRRAIVTAAAVGLLLSGVRTTASSFEWYGRLFGSIPALRAAHAVEPWRYSSSYELAKRLSFEGRLGDRALADEARALASRDVEIHPWHPDVRLFSSNVDYFLGDGEAAWEQVQDQLRVFPNDQVALAGAAVMALERGERSRAAYYARRVLLMDPYEPAALRVLESVMSGEGVGAGSDAPDPPVTTDR